MGRESSSDKSTADQKDTSRRTSNSSQDVSNQFAETSGLTRQQQEILSIQRTQGNAEAVRAIRRLKESPPLPGTQRGERVIRRTHITRANIRETLVNQPVTGTTTTGATGTLAMQTHSYTLNRPSFLLVRRPNATPPDVHVTVRILFMAPPQTTGNDAHGNPIFPHPHGTPIPASDPRRNAVLPVCRDLVNYWNGKYELAGHQLAGGTGGGPGPEIVLPITFEAVPVWNSSSPHDNADPVFLHGGADTGDSTRVDPNRATNGVNPSTFGTAAIDAGNWYLGRAPGQYGAAPAGSTGPDPIPLAAIYAHEYGHLLGIPDEYSQSNPAMHALLHRAQPTDPAVQARMDTELDRATSRMIILDAMRPRLLTAITGIAANVTAAAQAQQDVLINQLATSLRASWDSPALASSMQTAVGAQLTGQDRILSVLPLALRLVRQRLDHQAIARQIITSQLNATTFGSIMQNLLTAAIDRAQNGGQVSIASASGTIPMTISTIGINDDPALNQLQTAAQNMAQTLVGSTPSHAVGSAGPIPPVSPSQNLLDQLMSLPNQWHTMGPLFETSSLNTAMQESLTANLADGALATEINNDSMMVLTALRPRLTTSARAAATASINQFLSHQLQPRIDAQLDHILQEIANEPSAHGTATPTGTSAPTGSTPPPDAAMQARINQIHTAMQPLLAQARAVRDTAESTPAAAPGGAATPNNLHVSITVNDLMGSGSTDLRPDYMFGIADGFNHPQHGATDLRNTHTESDFVVRPITATPAPTGGTGTSATSTTTGPTGTGTGPTTGGGGTTGP